MSVKMGDCRFFRNFAFHCCLGIMIETTLVCHVEKYIFSLLVMVIGVGFNIYHHTNILSRTVMSRCKTKIL